MKAKLIDKDGNVVEEFILDNEPPTDKIIVDMKSKRVFMLIETGNGYVYQAQPYMLLSHNYRDKINEDGKKVSHTVAFIKT